MQALESDTDSRQGGPRSVHSQRADSSRIKPMGSTGEVAPQDADTGRTRAAPSDDSIHGDSPASGDEVLAREGDGSGLRDPLTSLRPSRNDESPGGRTPTDSLPLRSGEDQNTSRSIAGPAPSHDEIADRSAYPPRDVHDSGPNAAEESASTGTNAPPNSRVSPVPEDHARPSSASDVRAQAGTSNSQPPANSSSTTGIRDAQGNPVDIPDATLSGPSSTTRPTFTVDRPSALGEFIPNPRFNLGAPNLHVAPDAGAQQASTSDSATDHADRQVIPAHTSLQPNHPSGLANAELGTSPSMRSGTAPDPMNTQAPQRNTEPTAAQNAWDAPPTPPAGPSDASSAHAVGWDPHGDPLLSEQRSALPSAQSTRRWIRTPLPASPMAAQCVSVTILNTSIATTPGIRRRFSRSASRRSIRRMRTWRVSSRSRWSVRIDHP